MPIQISDLLSALLREPELNNRHDTWLWYTLLIFDENFCQFINSNYDQRNNIALFLQAFPSRTEQLLQQRKKQLVSKKDLAWITDERRLILWLTREVQNAINNFQFSNRFELAGKHLPIAMLDTWPQDINTKTYFIKNLEQKWRQHKARDKKYTWFKDEDPRCVFAFEWIEKNTLFFNPQTPRETYEDLLIFFDGANYTPEKEELFIGKIKKAWSQQKYRNTLKGKAQYNFVLSDKTIEHLDKISARHEISRARTLEILIELETEKGLYIAEKLRNARLLQKN